MRKFFILCSLFVLSVAGVYAEDAPEINRYRQSTDIYLHFIDKCYYLYFDNGKTALTNHSLQVIQQVADRLIEDPSICVEICAFCDNTGSNETNLRVGQARADRVAKELAQVYRIDKERLLPVYRGKIFNVRKSYSPNRRVEIRLMTIDELEMRKEEYLAKAVEVLTIEDPRPYPQNLTPATTSEMVEEQDDEIEVDIDVFKKRPVRITIKANKYTTFVGLARKYYNNPACWPYIYAANRHIAENNNPDRIPFGAIIVVPRLTADEIAVVTAVEEKAMLQEIQAVEE